MLVNLVNKKTGKKFNDPKVVTISLLRNKITITTGEDLLKPFDANKLTHNLDEIEIDIRNDK